jgi:NADPH:quinone reductase-like Zn-dependent oxidoreductase
VKAIVMHESGGPEVLRYEEVDRPELLSLGDAARAHELSESGHTRGKIVLRVPG